MTLKQERAIQLITSGQSDTVGKAMRAAGYSDITSKTPARLTKSKAFKQKLGQLAKAHNVTIEQYMMNLGLGMTAMKQNQFTGEVTEDIGMRLQANKQAERFLKLEQDKPQRTFKIPEDVDEIEAVRLIFNK